MRTSIVVSVLIAAASCGHPAKPAEPPPPPRPQEAEPAPDKTERPPAPPADAALIAEAKQFVADADKTVRKLTVDASLAAWANESAAVIEPDREFFRS